MSDAKGGNPAPAEAGRTQRRVLDAIAVATGPGFFRAFVDQLSLACDAEFAFVGRLDPLHPGVVNTVAASRRGAAIEPIDYAIRGTPCEGVVGRGFGYHAAGVRDRFPEDLLLGEWGIDSYMGCSVPSGDGKPLGIVSVLHTGTMRDAAQTEAVLRASAGRVGAEMEREIAVAALRESEARLSAVIAHSPGVAVQWYDRDGRVLLWNHASAEMFGWPSAEAVGRTLDALIHTPEEFRVFVETIAEIARTGRPVGPAEYTFRRRSGERGTCLSTMFRIPGVGDAPWFVCMDLDITERQRAEAEIRESQRFIQAVADASPHWIYVFDMDRMGTTYVNRPIVQELGHPPEMERIIDRLEAFASLMPPEEMPHLARLLDEWRTLPDGCVREDEYRLRHADGTYHSFLGRETVFNRREDGSVRQVLGTLSDITGRKRAEAERRTIEEQMRHAQKLESLGVLAGGIAHDFNNLLTSMLGYANLAAAELEPGSDAVPMLLEIEHAAQRASELTQQMLAYSGRGRFVTQAMQLDGLVDEMSKLLQTVVSKMATFRLELAPAAMEGDATQIRQIVMNLITNASDSLEGRPGVVAVRTGVREMDAESLRSPYLQDELSEGPYAFLEVSDTGCGMDGETVGRIFDPFFTTKFTGRGLGLAAVLGIVRGHHGTLQVTSVTGAGTTFLVLFPAVAEPTPETVPSAPASGPAAASGLVLLVEDEETVRSYARRVLEGAGFEVLVAEDGVEALDVFGRCAKEVRAVVLDLTMPRMDGWETLARMQALRADVPVILMSGFNEPTVPAAYAGLRVPEFLRKPFRPAELLARVDAIARPAT